MVSRKNGIGPSWPGGTVWRGHSRVTSVTAPDTEAFTRVAGVWQHRYVSPIVPNHDKDNRSFVRRLRLAGAVHCGRWSFNFYVSPQMDKARKFDSSGHSSALRSGSSAPGSVLAPEMPEQAQDTVLTTDLRGVITSCNLGLCRYGYAPEELVGKDLADLFCADDQSVLTNVVIPTVREKGRCEHGLRGQAKSGGEFCLHLCLTLVRDADSIPTGMVGVSAGIAEIKPHGASPSQRRAVADEVPLAR